MICKNIMLIFSQNENQYKLNTSTSVKMLAHFFLRNKHTHTIEKESSKIKSKHKLQSKVMITLFLKMLRLQYFYNIFITNHRWLVVIGSNLNLILRLLFYLNNKNQ